LGGTWKKLSFYKFSSFTCDFFKFEIPAELPVIRYVESIFLITEKLLWAEKVWKALTENLSGGP
jgi:hypothetical protein